MNREAIYQALFNLVAASASFKTASRRLKLWSDVPPSDRPAVFVAQRPGNYNQGDESQPGTITLEAEIFVYTDGGKDPNAIPASEMNQLLDAIDTALKGSPVTGLQTLGGLVSHCWIEGKQFVDSGDIDGDGVAVIPVKIFLPLT